MVFAVKVLLVQGQHNWFSRAEFHIIQKGIPSIFVFRTQPVFSVKSNNMTSRLFICEIMSTLTDFFITMNARMKS